jgi:hypothetical protein
MKSTRVKIPVYIQRGGGSKDKNFALGLNLFVLREGDNKNNHFRGREGSEVVFVSRSDNKIKTVRRTVVNGEDLGSGTRYLVPWAGSWKLPSWTNLILAE